jgi:type I restriction enzyme S subunit
MAKIMKNVLPKGWKEYKFIDISHFIDYRGKTPKKTSSGIPLITAKNVKLGYLNVEPKEFINANDYESWMTRGTPQIGDVLFTTEAPLGNVAQLDTTEKRAFAQRLITFKRKKEIYIDRFLYYTILSPLFRIKLNGKATGSTVKGIKSSILKKFLIPLPPLPEQQRIVNKLDALFARIDEAIQLVETNLELIPSLKMALLEKAFKGQLFGEVSLGKNGLPKGWELTTISEVAYVKGGKRLPKGQKLQDTLTNYPYIRVSDFTNDGTIDLSNIKYITKEIYEAIKRYIISDNDIYISIAGTIGKTGIIPKELNGANLTENAAKIVFKEGIEINKKYFYFFTLSVNFMTQIGLATKAVAMPKLALKRLSQVKIAIPQLNEQTKIVNKLNQLFQNIDQIKTENKSKLKHLQDLKKSLLEQAFQGKL